MILKFNFFMDIMTKVAVLAEKYISKDGSIPDFKEVSQYLDDNFNESEMEEASFLLFRLLLTL